ncbi:MAG: NUDIX hydrolase [Candidatus Omnitrophica bacterium]|nr:NUDIX hydrolase [Candidatus Omnitrophota bacterium]
MKRRQVFKGRLLNVFVEERRLPNGYKARLEVIRHPGAALIVPFLTRDKVILLRQYRGPIDTYIYELPAGTLDKNERPVECARREVIEETGYRSTKMTKLGMIIPVPGYSTERIYIFKAENLTRVGANNYSPLQKTETRTLGMPDEVIKAVIVTRAMVRRMFKQGRIVDAKTIAAFAFCGWL